MSTTLLSGLRHQVKGRVVHRRMAVVDEVAAGVAKGVEAPGSITRGIKGDLLHCGCYRKFGYLLFALGEKARCFSLDEGSTGYWVPFPK